MSGLTQSKEMTRSGRTLIAKLMKGTAVNGISHIAIGTGPVGGYSPYGFNYRMGNNMEMTGHNPVVVHNDWPVFNTGSEGTPNIFYFIDQVNSTTDVVLNFGNDSVGPNTLRTNMFNHLFMIHRTTSGGYGIADLFNAPTSTATMPTIPDGVICYIGYVETFSSTGYAVRTINNPARMFSEIARAAPNLTEFLGDVAINGALNLDLLQPSLISVSTEPNPALMVRGEVSPGINTTVGEMAILGDAGTDIIAWAAFPVGVPISNTQSLFARWAIGF